MSKKLYPPNIGGTIPAFCGTVLTVPFSMNKGVGKSEIGGFALKIKTVNGEYKGFVQVFDSMANSSLETGYDIETKYEVKFNVQNIKFEPGQYYKIQLAYIYNDLDKTVGYYSTVGVVKYTIEPTLYIENLTQGRINMHNYYYTGVYNQRGGDITEKMYSSRFIVTDKDGAVVKDTDFILHNTSQDNSVYEQTSTFQLAADLDLDKSYFIQFFVKTTNGLEIATKKYRIMQRRSISPEIEAQLKAKCNYDNGSVELFILDKKDAVISGKFLISRASNKNGWAWEEFKRFNLQSVVPDKWSLVDYTVEQGVKYRYSLQQYNDHDVFSDRIISSDVYVDFEDSFLYDGNRQLKIKFNPQVSSFSKTILETKSDTIGSKYPFITRNGNVNYKEFPINGLISYHMDDNELFFKKKDLDLQYYSTQLTGENIYAERKFKYEVWDWLTDGHPKIFKSPAEGNFLITLMNVSLTPENGLSRMLHSFSASACEIGEYTIENLANKKVLVKDDDFALQKRWKTIPLTRVTEDYLEVRDLDTFEGTVYIQQTDNQGNITYVETTDFSQNTIFYRQNEVNKTSLKFAQINDVNAYSVEFTEMVPGSRIQIEDEIIQIGASGTYMFKSETPISYIGVQGISSWQGLCTYSYLSSASNVFNHIQKVEIIDVPIQQFVGTEYQFEEHPLDRPSLEEQFYTSKNLLQIISDSKNTVLNTNFMHFEKRPAIDIYVKIDANTPIEKLDTVNYSYYTQMDCRNDEYQIEDLETFTDDLYIYPVRRSRNDYREQVMLGEGQSVIQPYLNEGYYVSINSATSYGGVDNGGFAPYTGWAYDGKTKQFFQMTPELYQIILNDEIIELKDKYSYDISDTSSLTYVEISQGIVANLSYWKQVKEYSFEKDDNATYYSKLDYEKTLSSYLEQRDNIICCQIQFEPSSGSPGFSFIHDKKKDGAVIEEWVLYPSGEIGDYVHYNLKTKRIDSLDKVTLQEKYNDYILNLNKALTKYKEDNGII